MSEGPPIVHIIDDDTSMRSALQRLLDANGIASVAYASAPEFPVQHAALHPGCLVLDVNLPEMNGVDFFELLQRQRTQLPVVFLTGYGNIPMTVRVIQAGAVDFLTKPVEGRSFLAAVRRALARDAEQRQAEREADSIRARYDRLTPRERQVLSHVVAGRLNKQIAFDLNAALRTVKAHRAQIMKKMQVRSVADLVRLAEHLDVSAPLEPVAAPRPVRYARTANH